MAAYSPALGKGFPHVTAVLRQERTTTAILQQLCHARGKLPQQKCYSPVLFHSAPLWIPWISYNTNVLQVMIQEKNTVNMVNCSIAHTSFQTTKLCPVQVFTCQKEVDRNRLLCVTHNCFYTHVHKPGSIIMTRKFSLSMWYIQREQTSPVQTDIRNLLMKATQKLIRQYRGRKLQQKWSIFFHGQK